MIPSTASTSTVSPAPICDGTPVLAANAYRAAQRQVRGGHPILPEQRLATAPRREVPCAQHSAHDDQDIATQREGAQSNEPRTDRPPRRCGCGTHEWQEEEQRPRDEGEDAAQREQAKSWRMRLGDEEPSGEHDEHHTHPIDAQRAEA